MRSSSAKVWSVVEGFHQGNLNGSRPGGFTAVKTGCLLHDGVAEVQSESGSSELQQVIAEDLGGRAAQR